MRFLIALLALPLLAQQRTSTINNVTGIWGTGNGVFMQSSGLQKSKLDSGLTFNSINLSATALQSTNRAIVFGGSDGTTMYVASRDFGMWRCDSACQTANAVGGGEYINDGLTEVRITSLCKNDLGEPILGGAKNHVYVLKTGKNYWLDTGFTGTLTGCGVNAAGHVIATANEGTIFKSTNHGYDGWTSVLNTGILLFGMGAAKSGAPDTLVVGGENDGIFLTTNGGESSGDWTNIAPGVNGYTSPSGFAGHNTAGCVFDSAGTLICGGSLYLQSVGYITASSITGDKVWVLVTSLPNGLPNINAGILLPSGDVIWSARLDGAVRTTNISSSGITDINSGLGSTINQSCFRQDINAVTGKVYCAMDFGGGVWRTNQNMLTLASGGSVTWEQFNGPWMGVVKQIIDAGSNTLYAACFGAGLCKSTDGGDTWTSSHSGMTSYRVNGVFKNPSDGNLYVSSDNVPIQFIPWGGGVFKSTDSGATFTQKVNGWGQTVTGGLSAIATFITGVSTGEMIAGSINDGIWRTTDSAANWTQVSTANNITSCVTRTSDDKIFCASTSGTGKISTDKGATYSNCGAISGGPVMNSITFDGSGNLIVATDSGVRKSTNDCTSWSSLSGVSGNMGGVAVLSGVTFAGTQDTSSTSTTAGKGLLYRSFDTTTWVNTFPYPVSASLMEDFSSDRDNGETPTPRKLWSAYTGDDQNNTFSVDTTNKWGRMTAAPAGYWTVSGGTLTSVVVSSNTATATTGSAHNLTSGLSIWFTGVTGDTDLNATWANITVTGSTTFTFTTTNVSNGTYNNSGMAAGKCFVNSAPEQYCGWYTNILPQDPSYNYTSPGTSTTGYSQRWLVTSEKTLYPFSTSDNRLSLKIKCNKDVPRVAFNGGVSNLSFGNYIRNQNNSGGTTYQGTHYYWTPNLNLYTDRWAKIDLTCVPQQIVSDPQGGQKNFPCDPETTTNNNENVKMMNGLTRWYLDTEPQAEWEGSVCDFTTVEFWRAVPEPEVYVQLSTLTYNGTGYDLIVNTDKNSTSTFDVRVGTASCHQFGWNSCTTVSGSPFSPSNSAYPTGPTITHTSAELPTVYFAIRPNMSLSGATNATPIVITMNNPHGLPDCSVFTIAGVGGNTAANGTRFLKFVSTSYNTSTTSLTTNSTTYQLYSDAECSTAVAGNGSYTSGGTVTSASDSLGFVEIIRTADVAAASTVGGSVSGGKGSFGGKAVRN